MKYKPIYVQIKRITDENMWYKKKKNHVFEVREDENQPDMYFLTPKALKHLKKAKHLQMGIWKEDCEIVDDCTREPFTIVQPKYKESHIDRLCCELCIAVKENERKGRK